DEHWRRALKREAPPLRLPKPAYSLRVRAEGRVIYTERDGDRVFVRDAGQNLYFDLAAHRVVVNDATGCKSTGYPGTDLAAADWYPITQESGYLSFANDMAVKTLRWEVINGMRLRLVENRWTAGPFREYFWLPEQYDVPLRMAFRLDEPP